MARKICIRPCPVSIALPQIKIPMMGNAMKAQGDLAIKGGCDGCELVGNLLLQLNPLLGALGLPLCLLGCAGAIVGFVKAIPDAIGPLPDPTVIITAVSNVVTKCNCVVSMALPPPVGVICDFLLMVRDIINMITTIIVCLVGLVTHLASFTLKAAILLADPDPAMQATGQCLGDQGQLMMNLLNQKATALGAILAILEPVFTLLAAVTPPPFATTIQDLKNGFASFSGSTPSGCPPGTYLTSLTTLSSVMQTVANTFTTIVAVCPGA